MARRIKVKVRPVHEPQVHPASDQVVPEHCLDLHKKIIFTSGLWVSEPHQKLRLNGHFYFLTRFAVAVGTLIVLSQIVDSTSNVSNMEFLTENLYVSIIFSMSIVKIVTVMQKPRAIQRLICLLEAMKRDDQTSLPEEKRLFSLHRTIVHWLTIVFCITCGFVASGFALIPVADSHPNITERILPFRMWTPFNHTSTPTYEMMYATLSVISVCAGLAIAVFDTLFVAMMLTTIGQLKILQYKLTNIRAIALRNIEREREARYSRNFSSQLQVTLGECHHSAGVEKKDESLPSSPVQVVTTPGPVLYRRLKPATYDRIAEERDSKKPAQKTKDARLLFGDKVERFTQRTVELLDEQASKALEGATAAQEVDGEMQRLLGECVDHHVAILNFISNLEEVFWGALVFQIFTSLAICVVVYQVTQAPHMNVKVIVMLMIICAGVFQLFLYCWFSTVITHETYKLNEAMYFCDWLDSSPSFKRSMQIVMCRTEQCPQLTVAGFMPLSLVMFRKVLKQSYSTYSLITGLDSGVAMALNDLGI